MGTNIFSVMNTAKLGLLTQQAAIEVTGQNIANVQTKGFTRQDVRLETTTPRTTGLGHFGTGVRIGSIARAHDQFLFGQLVEEDVSLGNFAARQDVFVQLEALLNDTGGNSLNAGFSNFFNGLQDISTNPTGLPGRSDILAEAGNLTSIFNRLGEDLFGIQQNLDRTVAFEVTEINGLTQEIARLNTQIHGNEPGPILANDLRDERDRLIRELAGKIDIDIRDETNGQIDITLQSGRALVLGRSSFTMSVQPNSNNRAFNDVLLDDGSGVPVNVTADIQDGRMRGLLDMRDTEVEGVKDKLDRLAAGLVREFNRVHNQGLDLNGVSGLNFFEPLSPTVINNANNVGTATVSATNASPTTSSVDKYEIVMTGSNSFALNNLTTGQASGTFTFAAGTAFNLANGLSVNISAGAVAGDRFRFSVSENASNLMALSSDVAGQPARIAAGLNTTADGNNAINLSNLQNSQSFDSVSLVGSGSGTFTFNEFYDALVGGVGVKASSANSFKEQQDGIMLQLENRRESISGVSLDEEMLNLIKFQQAFAASARVISVVEEMFDVLQNRI